MRGKYSTSKDLSDAYFSNHYGMLNADKKGNKNEAKK